MKRLIPFVLLAVSLSLSSCFTLIETIASSSKPVAVVTTPAPVTTTVVTTTTTHKPSVPPQTTQIVITDNQPDYYRSLDLRAVAAAFAESRSVREFEQLLNSSRYMVSNLDLNRDGWIDYLRVVECKQGWTHVLYVQAVLGFNMYQNVATIVVETQYNARYVQIVGDPFIYGPNYYINPVFRATPYLYTVMCGNSYTCWTSPYGWNNYPSYYSKPAPVYVTHYEAYVTTYLSNHSYCREVHYTTQVHYANYQQIGQASSRNDYAQRNPSQSFSKRYTEANAAAYTSSTRQPSTSTTTTSSTSTRQPSTSTTTSSTSTRQPSTSTTTSTPSRTTTAQPASTTVSTRVQNSGATRTQVTRVNEQGVKTVSSTRTQAATSSTPSRQASSSTPTRQTSGSSTNTRQASGSGSTRR